MTRVQKKFLAKIWPPFAIMAYIFVVMQIFLLMPSALMATVLALVFVVGPLVGLFFREAWKDAKWEVERENQTMVNTLKDV